MKPDESPVTVDVIDQLMRLDNQSPLWSLRHARDKVATATQSSYECYFAENLSELNRLQRLQIAKLCCELTHCRLLTDHYATLISAASVIDGVSGVNEVTMQAARHFATVLTTMPISGDKPLIHTLLEVGLSTSSIVALAQLIAFISYQTRLIQGLIAMRDDGLLESKVVPSMHHASPQILNEILPLGSLIRVKGFTNESLDWKSWLPIQDIETASAEQLAILKESHPKAMTSDYYLVLIQQAELLKQRSSAFNAIMYAPGGLSRSDRELGATVVSRINGCVYCASVHAQRFEQLGKRNDVIVQVFEDPYRVTTNDRDRAITDFSIQMTLEPHLLAARNIRALTAVGLAMNEVLDLIHSVAIFAWANRLMLNLGEPVTPNVNLSI
jgi:uncharacterized peroxidase-related enzyme